MRLDQNSGGEASVFLVPCVRAPLLQGWPVDFVCICICRTQNINPRRQGFGSKIIQHRASGSRGHESMNVPKEYPQDQKFTFFSVREISKAVGIFLLNTEEFCPSSLVYVAR